MGITKRGVGAYTLIKLDGRDGKPPDNTTVSDCTVPLPLSLSEMARRRRPAPLAGFEASSVFGERRDTSNVLLCSSVFAGVMLPSPPIARALLAEVVSIDGQGR